MSFGRQILRRKFPHHRFAGCFGIINWFPVLIHLISSRLPVLVQNNKYYARIKVLETVVDAIQKRIAQEKEK